MKFKVDYWITQAFVICANQGRLAAGTFLHHKLDSSKTIQVQLHEFSYKIKIN